MTNFARCWVFAASILLTATGGASAHPHVFVTAKSELIYGPDGQLKAIRHAWTFDEMFSTFAAQGLDKNGDGKLSRDELAELTKTNVDSLKEFDYFTLSKMAGKKIEFGDPIDYWMEGDEKGVLTLHFTLPVKSAGFKGSYTIEVYDPTYFVSFSFGEDEPVLFSGAPVGCKAEVKGPSEASSNPSESFFTQLQAGADYGAQFANRINVRCP
jgi:ABC-type uncharacterized transport system substrate-binding protein